MDAARTGCQIEGNRGIDEKTDRLERWEVLEGSSRSNLEKDKLFSIKVWVWRRFTKTSVLGKSWSRCSHCHWRQASSANWPGGTVLRAPYITAFHPAPFTSPLTWIWGVVSAGWLHWRGKLSRACPFTSTPRHRAQFRQPWIRAAVVRLCCFRGRVCTKYVLP